MLRTFAFVLRLLLAWALVIVLLAAFWSAIPFVGDFMLPINVLVVAMPFVIIGSALSHLERVRMRVGGYDRDAVVTAAVAAMKAQGDRNQATAAKAM